MAKGESGAGRTRGSGEPNAKERKKKAKEACEGKSSRKKMKKVLDKKRSDMIE